MSSSSRSSNRNTTISPALRWWKSVRPAMVGVMLVLVLTLILIFDILPVQQLELKVGQEAPEDILAPHSITYVSTVLTDKARQEAEANVRDVYNPPDMRVARAQVSRTRLILDFIETVRADSLAGRERQGTYFNAVPEIDLGLEQADTLLDLTAAQWDTVRQETLNVVDEAMRAQIRDDRLPEAQAAIPLLVRLGLAESEAAVVTSLAQQLIVSNSSFNAQLTEQYKQEAKVDAQPVQQSFDINSTIVRAGEAIDEADIEAMERFGLLQTESKWTDSLRLFIAVVLIVVLLSIYVQRFYPAFLTSGRHLTLISAMLILFTLTAKIMVPGRAVLPFLYPSAALAMLLTVLFDANLAIIVSVCLAAVAGFIGGNSLELTVFTAVGGIIAALFIKKSPRTSAFFRTGILVAVANSAVILIYRLNISDTLGILQLVGASFLNGLFSAGLTLTGFFFIGNVFNVVTSMQLQELARLDHPLLQELLSQAPGTYHHSLMVSNLAEQAARRITADADLVRVGSFYHDVGKIARPYFFTENQDGANVHSRLDPLTSAQTITRHVQDGLDLAKRYRLPEKIRAFIPEHHGTRTIKFFYQLAVKAADDPDSIDKDDFRYPGPKPQSKETAIVLLADSCEAASTAMQSRTEDEIEELVESIVNQIATEGELDESGLTMGDLRTIKESFTDTLQGRFHVRPKYPGQRTSGKLLALPQVAPVQDGGKVTTKPAMGAKASAPD